MGIFGLLLMNVIVIGVAAYVAYFYFGLKVAKHQHRH